MISIDLVFDILVRLPGKALVRFSCVSEIWRKMIITDPSFKAMYHSRATKTNLEYLLQIHCKPPFMCLISRCNELFVEQEATQLSVSSLTHPNMTLVGSSNGLLCLVASNDTVRTFGNEIYLLNPAIRRLKLLPPSPGYLQPWSHQELCHFGIGFDSLTADCKVLKITEIIRKYRITEIMRGRHRDRKCLPWLTRVQIYSLKSNSWKYVSFLNYKVFDIPWARSTAFLNGAFYWVAERNLGDRYISWDSEGVRDLFIVSFDLTEETFKEIRLPESLYFIGNYGLRFGWIGEFKGKLCLMLNNDSFFEMWVMMEGSSWVKTYWEESHRNINLADPLGVGLNNEIILQLENSKNIVAHDLDKGTRVDHGTREVKKMYLYAPSLALLGEESQSFEEAGAEAKKLETGQGN